MQEVFLWLQNNYVDMFIALAGLVGVIEVIVRFTPTEKDDGAVQRIGEVLKKIMDFLKIPNNLK